METIFKEHAAAIGHLTIAFNSLEQRMTGIIGVLLGDSYAGEIVTAPLPFPKKVDVFAALARHKITDTQLLKTLSELADSFAALNDQRNGLVHAEWWPEFINGDELESINRRRLDIRGRQLRVRNDAPSPTEIMSLAREIYSVTGGLDFIEADIEAALMVRGQDTR